MDRIIEERQVSHHQVAIIEELMDEGVGYALMVDGVRIAENEPLDNRPTNDEILDILSTHGFL
ncbi:MAG: hypothetical protein GX440_05585 [Propionibacterium sp.]|jgi:hypothetical protein|nr:hypothetical protein [Propionibacterium sp.]